MPTCRVPAGTYEGLERCVRFESWIFMPTYWDVFFTVKPGINFQCTAQEAKDHKSVALKTLDGVELALLPNKFSAVAAWIIDYAENRIGNGD
jgi:hypothetical protein